MENDVVHRLLHVPPGKKWHSSIWWLCVQALVLWFPWWLSFKKIKLKTDVVGFEINLFLLF